MEHKDVKICVCVRKRPMSSKENAEGEIECISASNPSLVIHECKLKVDQTKFVENHDFVFDNVL